MIESSNIMFLCCLSVVTSPRSEPEKILDIIRKQTPLGHELELLVEMTPNRRSEIHLEELFKPSLDQSAILINCDLLAVDVKQIKPEIQAKRLL